MAPSTETIKFLATPEHGDVTAILDRPQSAQSLMVLGHGSGSNMHVPFIRGLSGALVRGGVATFRFEYPYSERQDFVPYSDVPMDDPDVLVATVRAAVAAAAGVAPDLSLFAGGHSVSGQTASVADSESPLPNVRGVIMLGFPLKGDLERAAHFVNGTNPLLFLQGTADTLGDTDQMKQVVDSIGARATLHFVESASHGFKVPGKPDEEVHWGVGSAHRGLDRWPDLTRTSSGPPS